MANNENAWLKDTPLADLYHRDARSLSNAELERFEKADDRDLMRASGSMHNLPAIEAMRRLRKAVLAEEHATKWLTAALLLFTVAIFGLTVVEFFRH